MVVDSGRADGGWGAGWWSVGGSFGEGSQESFEEGEEDVYGIADQEGDGEGWKRGLVCDGDVVEEADDGSADACDEKACRVCCGWGEGAVAHLVFEGAQEVGAGAEESVEDGQDAGGDGSVEDGYVGEQSLGEVADVLIGVGDVVASGDGVADAHRKLEVSFTVFEGGCVFKGKALAGQDEVVELAGAGVDDADDGGILLQIGDDVGFTDSFRGKLDGLAFGGWRAEFGAEFYGKGVGAGDVLADGGRDGGSDEGGDGDGDDDAGEDDGPDEVVVDGGACVVVVGLEAFGGDGLEARSEAGERTEEIGGDVFGPPFGGGGSGAEDGAAGLGGDVDADLSGVLEEALGVAEGIVEVRRSFVRFKGPGGSRMCHY
jgi:hypothetical protein